MLMHDSRRSWPRPLTFTLTGPKTQAMLRKFPVPGLVNDKWTVLRCAVSVAGQHITRPGLLRALRKL